MSKCGDIDREIAHDTAMDTLDLALSACRAALAYDEAIRKCADDPDKMSSYCTAQGDDLNTLYADWLEKSHAALEGER